MHHRTFLRALVAIAAFTGTQAIMTAGSRVQFSYNEGVMEANDDYLGLEKLIPYRAGIKIDDESLVGYKVLGLRADYLRSDGYGLKDFIVWNSKKLVWDSDITQPATHTGSYMEGYFEEPVTLTDDGLFLGYGFTVETLTTATAYPIAYGTPAGTRNSCFISTGPDYGSKFIDYANDAGPLMITVFLEAPSDLPDALQLKSVVGRPKAYTGQTFQLTFRAMNQGTKEINTIDYSYTIDGQTSAATKTFTTPIAPVIGRQQHVMLPFDPVPQPGSYPMTVTINKINGKDNPAAQPLSLDLTVSDAGIDFDPGLVANYSYSNNFTGRMGSRAKTVYDVAVNANVKALKGLKILGAKVTGLPEENMGSFTLWSSTQLADLPDMEVVDVEQSGDEIIGGFHNPPVLDGNDLYIGYSMEVLHLNIATQTPVPYGAPVGVPGSFFLKTNEVAWNDFSDNYGSATITLYLDGDIADNAAALEALQSSNILHKQQPFTLKFEMANAGKNPITDVNYTYTLAGKTVSGVKHLDTAINGQLGSTGRLAIDFDPVDQGGLYNLNLAITKVNGVDNASPARERDYRLIIPSFYPVKRPLMEEATGTWCGWCGRGMVGMRELAREFPEFIGAAYHNNDPMMVTEDYPWAMDGYPSGTMDRACHLDPFYGSSAQEGTMEDMGIRADYLEACKKDAPADIALSTTWQADKSKLTATATVTFAFADENETYRMAYLLVKDGYTNPNEKAWWQSNSYSGLTTAGMLGELNGLGNPEPNYVYNDVVIEAKTNRGIYESLPQIIDPDTPYVHEYVFETASIKNLDGDTELMTDHDNLWVIAMVLNKNARVLNARKVKAGQSVGIANTVADEEPGQPAIYYDITGRRVARPHDGIFIEMQGNKARKVLK